MIQHIGCRPYLVQIPTWVWWCFALNLGCSRCWNQGTGFPINCDISGWSIKTITGNGDSLPTSKTSCNSKGHLHRVRLVWIFRAWYTNGNWDLWKIQCNCVTEVTIYFCLCIINFKFTAWYIQSVYVVVMWSNVTLLCLQSENKTT